MEDHGPKTSLWTATAAGLHLLVVVVTLFVQPQRKAAEEAARMYAEAENLRRFGRTQEAAAEFDRILRKYGRTPVAPSALYALALYDLTERENIASARARLERIRGEYEGYPEAEEAAKDLAFLDRVLAGDTLPVRMFYRALGNLRAGRKEQAVLDLERILLSFPNHPVHPEALSLLLRHARGAAGGRWEMPEHLAVLRTYPARYKALP